MQLLDTLAADRAVAAAERYLLSLAYCAAMHAAYGDAAYITAVVEARDEHLRVAFVDRGRGDVVDDCVKHCCDVMCRLAPVRGHPPLLGRAVNGDEIELVLRRAEREHEVKHHFVHLVGAAVGLVNLVDHHHWLEPHLDRLLQYEAGLRHRALESVHEQQASVSHVQHTLHLAAEVSVSRGVDDVDFYALVVDGDILGEDCYPSLAFEVIVVEYQLPGVLVFTEKVSCEEHFVHESSLAMVNVGYNGYVSDVLHKD